MPNLSHYGSDNLAESLEIDNLKHILSEHLKEKESLEQKAELSAKQAFWSQNSRNFEEPNLSTSTTVVEVPKELPKVSMVNSSLKKLKFHLASFDMVVKERTTAIAITEGDSVPRKGHNHYELKERINPLSGNVKEEKIKKELEEIETLNIELDHRVTKLVAENKHLKKTYKQLYDSIKSSRVNLLTSASGSQPQGNTKKDGIHKTQSKAKKNKLEEHPRIVSPSLNNKKSVVNTKAISFVTNSKFNVNSNLKCATCNGCLFYDNHDSCVLEFINSVNARVKSKSDKKLVVQIVLWYLDSGCSKHITRDRYQLVNFVQKFLRTVKFENDHVAKIMGYGDYKIGNVTILRVYFVEGLGNNLFSMGLFCDSDLEVAFRQHTCFIRNLDGADLLTGS
nr:integrase, catalytic region, zinc finger, CCHC-type, peptidase aspartic, catalytic [Tanacetum cinerariifolium]GEZ82428.1 integrase, catalytic region, zinc finger, CCHC-type, peptidase aspartic, catalytic [Tanacetum cinerariifolium]